MKKTYTFEADEKTYTAKLSYNEICDIEGVMGGVPIQKIFGTQEIQMSAMRVLMWGALKWKLRGITLQEAGRILEKLIEEKRFIEVSTELILLVPGALPVDETAVNESNEENDLEGE